MMAPVALYPDSLLAQVLMAATYPGDVADAVKWSKAHPDAKGDDAVRQVANAALGSERAIAGRVPAGAGPARPGPGLGAEAWAMRSSPSPMP